MQKKVAIVILNYNGKKLLEEFLPSVVEHTPKNYSVYVIDNASTDDSILFLQTHYANIAIVKNAANVGFASGYNEGLKKIDADYYILLNSDVAITEKSMERLIDFMECTPQAGAVQPKIKSYKQPTHFEYAGANGGFVDRLFYPLCRGRMIKTSEEDNGQYDTTIPIFWASGAAMCIRAKLFHALNGFDESFFAHQEEIDLCWRMQHIGYTCYCVPSAVVYHLGGGTLSYQNLQKMYLNHRNNLMMITKNLPLHKSLPIVITRIFLEQSAEGLNALLKGHFRFYQHLWKAHWDYIKWLFTHIGKMQKEYPKRKPTKLTGYLSFFLIFHYYVFRQTTFKELHLKP